MPTLKIELTPEEKLELKGEPGANAEPVDLSGYAKKTDIPQIPPAPDLTPYAKKTDIPEIPPAPDLSGYAKKSDIPAAPDLTGYATVEYVDSRPTGSGVGLPVIYMDSYTGSDDDRLDAALNAAASRSFIPAVVFPAREVNLNRTHTPFQGMKIRGPYGADGMKNPQFPNSVNHRVKLGAGIGTDGNSLFSYTGTANLYNVDISGLAFAGTGVQQFWHNPNGTLYACRFDALSFIAMRHGFGSIAGKSLMTYVKFTGSWTVLTDGKMFMHVAGSDNDFWTSGDCNMGNTGAKPNPEYYIWLDGVGKTRIGSLYLTCGNGFGIRFRGTGEGADLECHGIRLEGYHSTTPAQQLLWMESGNVDLHGGNIGFSASVIKQSGGSFASFGVKFQQVNGTMPFIEQTAGNAYLYAIRGGVAKPIAKGSSIIGDASVTITT